MDDIILTVRVAVSNEKLLRAYTSGFMQRDASTANRVRAMFDLPGHVFDREISGVVIVGIEQADTRCIACGNEFDDPIGDDLDVGRSTYGKGEFGFCKLCFQGRYEIAIDQVRERVLDALREQNPDAGEAGVDEWAFDYDELVRVVTAEFIHAV